MCTICHHRKCDSAARCTVPAITIGHHRMCDRTDHLTGPQPTSKIAAPAATMRVLIMSASTPRPAPGAARNIPCPGHARRLREPHRRRPGRRVPPARGVFFRCLRPSPARPPAGTAPAGSRSARVTCPGEIRPGKYKNPLPLSTIWSSSMPVTAHTSTGPPGVELVRAQEHPGHLRRRAASNAWRGAHPGPVQAANPDRLPVRRRADMKPGRHAASITKMPCAPGRAGPERDRRWTSVQPVPGISASSSAVSARDLITRSLTCQEWLWATPRSSVVLTSGPG